MGVFVFLLLRPAPDRVAHGAPRRTPPRRATPS